jgi:hypothetical protein
MYRLLLLTATLITVSSCRKKELLTPVGDIPDFYLSGKINDSEFSFAAGKSDYYMYTDVYRDDSNVAVYAGTLSKEGCNQPSCIGALTLKIRGTKKLEESVKTGIEDEILQQAYRYGLRNPKPILSVSLSAEPSFFEKDGPKIYTWKFGDGQTAQGDNPTLLFPFNISSMNACLSIGTPTNDCISQLCFDALLNSCSAEIAVVNQGEALRLTASYSGKSSPLYYRWTFADGRKVAGKSVNYLPTPGNDKERVCLEITDEEGCISRTCREVVLNSTAVKCAAGFNYQTTVLQPVFGMLQLQTAEILYTDANGITYSTALNATPGEQTLEIVEILDYKQNDDGRSVKRLKVRFDALLSSNNGASITLNQVEGMVGVAY